MGKQERQITKEWERWGNSIKHLNICLFLYLQEKKCKREERGKRRKSRKKEEDRKDKNNRQKMHVRINQNEKTKQTDVTNHI